jgi:hypothetical protein
VFLRAAGGFGPAIAAIMLSWSASLHNGKARLTIYQRFWKAAGTDLGRVILSIYGTKADKTIVLKRRIGVILRGYLLDNFVKPVVKYVAKT